METAASKFGTALNSLYQRCQNEKKLSSTNIRLFNKEITGLTNDNDRTFYSKENTEFRKGIVIKIADIFHNQNSKSSSKKGFIHYLSSVSLGRG